ncbi:MAG: hypothetical protein ABSA71_03530 [Desulfomonilia bacterium]|jgi:hypothetical protein
MRSGRSLEKLVLYLKRHRVGKGTVLIESPKRIRDKSTGRLCKHDVVLTINPGYHAVLVAIECRERGRPVGLSQLEAFAQKCSATSINKSVIVSSCGFTKTALCKAKALGIHCLPLEQIKSFPWFHCETKLRQIRTNYTHIDFAIIPEKDFVRKPASFMLINDDGETISPDILRDYLLAALIKRQGELCDLKTGDNVERIRMLPKNLSIIDIDTGITKKVRQINLVVYCKSEEMEQSFLLQEHKDTKPDTSYARLPRLLNKSDFSDVGIFMRKSKN